MRTRWSTSVNMSRSGAVAAEMALIVPLMSTMLFGVLQYGFAIYTYTAMETAARTGARQIVFGSNVSAAETATRAALPAWVASGATISTVENDEGTARMNVSVPGSSAALFGLLPMPATFTATAAMPRVNDRGVEGYDDDDDD